MVSKQFWLTADKITVGDYGVDHYHAILKECLADCFRMPFDSNLVDCYKMEIGVDSLDSC